MGHEAISNYTSAMFFSPTSVDWHARLLAKLTSRTVLFPSIHLDHHKQDIIQKGSVIFYALKNLRASEKSRFPFPYLLIPPYLKVLPASVAKIFQSSQAGLLSAPRPLIPVITKFKPSIVHACSAVSYSLQFHGLWPTRLLCSYNFPGKNTGVGCYFLLQPIEVMTLGNPCHPPQISLDHNRSWWWLTLLNLEFSKIQKFNSTT